MKNSAAAVVSSENVSNNIWDKKLVGLTKLSDSFEFGTPYF